MSRNDYERGLYNGDQGVTVGDLFSSTGFRQRLPWGSGTWSVSWDTARTTTNNPITTFDPSLQSGFRVAFSQPSLPRFAAGSGLRRARRAGRPQ